MDSISSTLPFQTSCWLIFFITFLVSSGKACFFTLTESEGTFAPLLYPQVNLDIKLCTWQIEAPIGKVVEILFEEVAMNSTNENGFCVDNITISDGAAPFLSEIIPPFCGDGPPWPRYPTQLLSQSHVMTVTLKKELVGSRGFRASYKHVDSREELVAVVAVENPAIILFDRFASLSYIPQIPLIGASHPSALSFDFITKYFYFTDIRAKFIGRVSLKTPFAVEKLVTDSIQNPLGVAVAYLTGLLYWTDADRHEVSVSRLDGTYRKSIMTLTPNCRTPRGVVLSRDHKYIFWTCESRIVKSKADGSEQNLDFVSGNIVNPTALAIDSDGTYLYWMDTHLGAIDRIRVDGAGRINVLSSDEGFFDNLHSFVMSDFAYYWTHPGKQQMQYYGKSEQALQSVYLVVRQTFAGLYYYKSDLDIPEQHLCSTENGGCNELCFPAENSFKCNEVTPTISNCPDDILESSSSLYMTVNWIEPTAVSRSSDQNEILPYRSRSHAPMSSFIRGTTEVVYLFRDDLGYEAECSFNVTVETRTSTTIYRSTVTEVPQSSIIQSAHPSDDFVSLSPMLLIVIGSVILVVCLTAITGVVVVLCCCGCCKCGCGIKEQPPMTQQPLSMTSQVPPWTTKGESYPVASGGVSHYVTNTAFIEDGEYLTIA
ncbi:Low-density lipoprotein receptor-related protein 5 [Holothuria leucospilota]|uniref:Low-density lipoprotein receptor-related protein 5 n=1 Tax=Holothuria leucospilota TaxID=206669 RepID=A0A9Q1CCC3_HOLLE|nr:Low-density lipoprotein receptor-related protein 5 [Holothuria leucospilota]